MALRLSVCALGVVSASAAAAPFAKAIDLTDHGVWALDSNFLKTRDCGTGTGSQYTTSKPLCEDHLRFDHGLGDGEKVCKVFRMFADKPSWPASGFCRTLVQTASNLDEGTDEQGVTKPYMVRTDMLNWFGHYASAIPVEKEEEKNWFDSEDIGHLGVYYNAADSENFDFVYVRPKAKVNCLQSGYVRNGKVLYYSGNPEKDAMKCSITALQMARKWFSVKVTVIDGSAEVAMSDEFGHEEIVAHLKPMYPQRATGGVIVANGFTNTAFFRHFYIRHVVPKAHAWSAVSERCEPDSRVSFVTNDKLCPSARPHHTCHVLKLHATTGTWPAASFCNTLPDSHAPFTGPYMVRADLFSAAGSIGIFYNAKSADDYDFLYVTINDARHCLQSGYVQDGKVMWYAKGVDKPWLYSAANCLNPVAPYDWFELSIKLDGSTAKPTAAVYLNGDRVATVNPHFAMEPRGGALVRNGDSHTAYAKNFEIKRNRDSTSAGLAGGCSHVSCEDVIGAHGEQHMRVHHSNSEWKGSKHTCTLTGPGKGTLGKGLSKIGTWQATEKWGRNCECFCTDEEFKVGWHGKAAPKPAMRPRVLGDPFPSDRYHWPKQDDAV
jgi:hypothetical protein